MELVKLREKKKPLTKPKKDKELWKKSETVNTVDVDIQRRNEKQEEVTGHSGSYVGDTTQPIEVNGEKEDHVIECKQEMPAISPLPSCPEYDKLLISVGGRNLTTSVPSPLLYKNTSSVHEIAGESHSSSKLSFCEKESSLDDNETKQLSIYPLIQEELLLSSGSKVGVKEKNEAADLKTSVLNISSESGEVSYDTDKSKRSLNVGIKQLYPKLNIESAVEAFHECVIASREELLKNASRLANEAYDEFFLSITNISRHEFFELVFNYHSSRRDLLIVQEKTTSLQFSLKNKEKQLWTSVSKQATARGTCDDHSEVEVCHKYTIMELDKNVEDEIGCMLNELENMTLANLAYYEYSSQVLKQKIDFYLSCLLEKPDLWEEEFSSSSFSSFSSLTSSTPKNQIIKTCISVLFCFQRKPSRDNEFICSTRRWLGKLVTSLLSSGCSLDRVFVLHHILRCPGDINSWAVKFIQQPEETVIAHDSLLNIFDCDLMKFSLPALMIILSPIPGRDELLKDIESCDVHCGPCPEECNFTILNAVGDELEIKRRCMKEFSDEDVVSLLKQIPLSRIFEHSFFLNSDGECHNNHSLNEKHIHKVMEFCYLLLYFFDAGLKTYALAPYAKTIKMVGQFVSNTVAFLSAHWMKFKESNLSRNFCIQVEIDRIVFHAVYAMLSSKEFGSLELLSEIPYEGVSPKMLWNLLWLYHCYPDCNEQYVFAEKDVPDKLKNLECRVLLQNKLKGFAGSDVLHILRAMKQMTRSKGSEDGFVCCVAQEVYEVSSSGILTEDIYKEALHLISLMAEENLFIVSAILKSLRSIPDADLKHAITLFKVLPLRKWVPEAVDMEIISDMLLSGSLHSNQNRLARTILNQLNWHYEETRLALPVQLHMQVAVLILKAYLEHHKPDSEGWNVTRGIKQVLRLYMPILFNEETGEGFIAWAWHLLFQLKLHILAQPNPPFIEIFDGEVDFTDLPNLHHDAWLQPLLSSYNQQHPVACYLVLVMTDVGHSLRRLHEKGLAIFSTLLESKQYAAAIQVLYFAVPFFVKNSQIIAGNEKFLTDLAGLIVVDRSSQTGGTEATLGAVLMNMQEMIKMQLSLAWKFSVEIVNPLIKLWLKILVKLLLLEHKSVLKLNGGICQIYYLLDFIVKFAFIHPHIQSGLTEQLMSMVKPLVQLPEGKKTIWSSWFDTSIHKSPLIMHLSSCYCWYAYAVIHCEINQTMIADLWAMTVAQMIVDPDSAPENAMKKSPTSCLPVGRAFLPIYRWALQALETPFGHPLLPLIYQNFFLYFLQRSVGVPGIHWSQKTSIGLRFFKGDYSSLLCKLKAKMQKAVDFYHDQLQKRHSNCKTTTQQTLALGAINASTDGCESNAKDIKLANDLYLLSRAFSAWIDDPALHEAVCLPALEPRYLVSRLKLILANDQRPWLEYVDIDRAKDECILKPKYWIPAKSLSPSGKNNCSDVSGTNLCQHPLPLPPGEVIELPISEVAHDLFSSSESLSNSLNEDQKVICREAVKFETCLSKMKRLNQKYKVLIPNEYQNEDKQVTVSTRCYRRARCVGPACVKVLTQKSVRDEKVSTHISLNRTEFQKLLGDLTRPPSNDLCAAAIHMEFVIRKLVGMIKASNDGSNRTHLKNQGVSLFYDQLVKAQEILSTGPNSTSSHVPSKQFFATCIEILGKELIMEQEECLPLLRMLLKNPAAAELASPYFCPHKLSEQNFLTIYEEIVKSIEPESENVLFVVLSKVNLKTWLSGTRPVYSTRLRLLEMIRNALCTCGSIGKVSIALVEDVIRKHFCNVFMYEFPELFTHAVENLLKGAESKFIHVDIWYDLFHCLGCSFDRTEYLPNDVHTILRTFALNRMLTPDQKLYITSPPLHFEQITHTLEYLHSFFKRKSNNSLFKMYKDYMKPITILLGLLGHSLLEFACKDVYAAAGDHSRVGHLWNTVYRAFELWINPRIDISKNLLEFPWSTEEENDAKMMMLMFASCVEFHHAYFKDEKCGETILSHAWQYYVETYVRSGFRNYCVSVFHEAFAAVVWSTFYPSVKDIKYMCEVFQSDIPECRQFLCKIFAQIVWPKTMDNLMFIEQPYSVRLALGYLVIVIVRVGCEHSIRDVKQMYPKLLKNFEALPWIRLDLENVEEALNLYGELYNPRNLICDHTDKKIDFYLLNFLKILAGLIPRCQMSSLDSSHDVELILRKRRLFLGKLVSFITQPCGIEQVDKVYINILCQIFLGYWKEIEIIVLKDFPTSEQMNSSIPLVEKLLTLLNHIEHDSIHKEVLQHILTWLRSNPNTPLLLPAMTSACAHLTNMSSLVALMECCMETRYAGEMQDPSEVINVHRLISSCFNVSESKHDEFVNCCIQQNACLSLHEYIARRICKSSDAESNSMLLKRMVYWLEKMKVNDLSEVKSLLLWDKILDLSLKLIEENGAEWVLPPLQAFCHYLTSIGQEKDNLLSMIGLCTISTHSVNFRFLSVALSAFILLQLPDDGSLRIETFSPGYVEQTNLARRSTKSVARVSEPHPSKEGLKALEELRRFVAKKPFAALKSQIERAVSYICNPECSFIDSREVLKELALQAFPNHLYLYLLKT